MHSRSIAFVSRTLAASFLVWAAGAEASRFGRDGFSGNPDTNNGATCTACHAPGAATPTVTLSGPQALDAGTIAEYTVTISGGPAVTGGVDVSTTGAIGSFLPLDDDLHLVGEEISHAEPKAFASGSVSFTFQWQAPDFNGDVTLYAAGNSSNGQLDLLGDGVGTDQLTVTVQNGDPPPPPPPPPPPAEALLELVVDGLERPVVIRHADDARLFVVEQPGRIRLLTADRVLLPTPFLDIAGRVDDEGSEQGLLGLAFHPDYADNGYFYVYYTYDPPGAGSDHSRVSRFSVGDDPDLADPASELVLLEFEHPFANHNGGDLHFGPDGYLYIASGDGGGGGDPLDNAQNPNSPLGKLLRIDVDGAGGAPDCNLVAGDHYGIPADNAYTDGPGGAGCDELYALGLRNPWRFAFDRATDDLWIADVGQSAFEEIDFVPGGTGAGLNFGWRCYEGDAEFNLDGCDDDYFFPLLTTAHADGNCSITGGHVYRGAGEPALYGRYFFSDFCNTAIRTARRSGGEVIVEDAIPAGELSQPSTFGEDVDGELYVASLTGAIYRIRSAAAAPVRGEAGKATVAQANAGQWHDVAFARDYDSPVVVMGPPGFDGTSPTSVRVRQVHGTGFQFQIDEWEYLDQTHTAETLGYVVVERGEHTLADGTRIAAGTRAVGHGWQQIAFATPFAAPPVVLVQVGSDAEPWAVAERLRNVTAAGFEVRLQEEEAADGQHAPETLHWIAIAAGPGPGREAAIVPQGIDHTGARFAFANGYGQTPAVLADLQSYNGPNPATVRLVRANAAGMRLFAEEEQSADQETWHRLETLGYLVVTPGPIE